MKKILIALALVAATVASTAPPTLAYTPNCASRIELNKVQIDWRRGKVHRVFDVTGRNVDSYRSAGWDYRAKEYRHCKANVTIFILYRRPVRTYGPWRVFFLSSSTSSV